MAVNVLIVDDSPAMRSLIGRILQLSGLELGSRFEAGNGHEALSVLKQEWVDVILTDINMPGMNGEQLMEALEGDDELKSVPVIVVSTDGTDARIHRLCSMGARGYIRKPFRPETLRNEVQKVLGGGQPWLK
jgi:two-component system chemotaxis response regulator CheY